MIIEGVTLAYIAGIIDGEGSIIIHRRVPRKGLGQLKVVVSNTNRDLLEFLQFYFNGSICSSKAHLKYPKNKPCHQWTVSCHQALPLLEMIFPYLRIKRPQAEIAIAYQKAKTSRGTKNLTEEQRALDEVRRIMVASLNKKGGEQ